MPAGAALRPDRLGGRPALRIEAEVNPQINELSNGLSCNDKRHRQYHSDQYWYVYISSTVVEADSGPSQKRQRY